MTSYRSGKRNHGSSLELPELFGPDGTWKQVFSERSGRMISYAMSPRGSPSNSPPRQLSPSRSPSPPSRWSQPRLASPSSPKEASASFSSMSEEDENEKYAPDCGTHAMFKTTGKSEIFDFQL
nr:choline-phosphate cytidylyltransferase B [Salvelinus alpinus]